MKQTPKSRVKTTWPTPWVNKKTPSPIREKIFPTSAKERRLTSRRDSNSWSLSEMKKSWSIELQLILPFNSHTTKIQCRSFQNSLQPLNQIYNRLNCTETFNQLKGLKFLKAYIPLHNLSTFSPLYIKVLTLLSPLLVFKNCLLFIWLGV